MDKIVENIENYTGNIDDNSVYVVLINADSKPPHLGVVVNGVYKSISVRGKTSESFYSWVKEVEKKRLFTIFN